MNIDAMDVEELDRLMREHVMDVPESMREIMESFNPSRNDLHALKALRHLQSGDWHVAMRLDVERGAPDDGQTFTVAITDGTNTGAGMAGTFGHAFSCAALKFALDRKGVAWC